MKRFKGTKTLIKDFGLIADILGHRMGCFLFQIPPSYHYTPARLDAIVSQLDRTRRNVVEFRHASWWNENVYSAFREAGVIFCSLPDELIRTADDVYIRLHGPKRWYCHDYSEEELLVWVNKIKASAPKRVWVYFNNDADAYAPKNAMLFWRILARNGAQRPDHREARNGSSGTRQPNGFRPRLLLPRPQLLMRCRLVYRGVPVRESNMGGFVVRVRRPSRWAR